MKNLKNDYLIRMFTSSDNYRPAMMKVHCDNGFLYATNAHIVAKIKADLCVKKYEAVEKYPNCEKVISDHKTTESKKVNVSSIFDELMKIEVCFKPKMIECNECCGDGVLTCDHCDSEYKCKECDGTGEKEGTELELSGENNCTFFNRKYNLKYLDLIIRTAVYTGVKEIEVLNGRETGGTIFKVGDFEILLMTVYDPS